MRLVEVRNLTDRPFTVEAHMEAGSAFSFEEEDLQIPAGGSRSVRVVFRPSERGRAVGLLYLLPCRKCSMRVVELAGTAVALSGTGGGPLLQASPAALDFGTWFTGRARSARLRLENVGEAGPIWVTSLSVEGDPSFSLGQPALPLDVSEGAEVDVWFLGEVDGAREGTLVVRTTWPAQPELRVPLYGEAYTPAECELVAEPEKVRFGLLGLPVQKRKTVRLRNVDSTCCRFVQALQFSGEHASHFSLADPPPEAGRWNRAANSPSWWRSTRQARRTASCLRRGSRFSLLDLEGEGTAPCNGCDWPEPYCGEEFE